MKASEISHLSLADSFGFLLGLLVVGCLVSLILAAPIMWLWNFVSPGVFHGPEITYWQAWAMSLLASILFKSRVSNGE